MISRISLLKIIEKLQEEIAILKEDHDFEMEYMKDKCEQYEDEIKDLESDLKDANYELEEMTSEADYFSDKVEDLEYDIDARDDQIEELNDKISELDSQLADYILLVD